MSIVNRRNALVGWAAIKFGKRVAKRKTKPLRGFFARARSRFS
jgi:hypothetical protein